jgi:WD40 repeat protein
MDTRSGYLWVLRLGFVGAVCLTQATASVPAPLTATSALNQAFQAGSRLTTAALSPDGQTLATTGRDNRVLLFDVASGQEHAALVGSTSPITGIAFDPTGKVLVGVGEDHRIVLWNLTSGTKATTLLADRLRTNVTEVAFSPDGMTLASIGDDPRVILWDLATGATRQVLSGHGDVVNGIAFSPGGKLLASGSRDATAILWDPASGAERAVLRSPDGLPVAQVAFTSDGKNLLSVRPDGAVLLWDVATGALEKTLSSGANRFTQAAFSPDGRLLASVDDANRINLWEVATGRPLLVLADPAGVPVSELAFSADGSVLASARGDTVRLWNTGSGRQISTCFFDLGITITSVVFSPDGGTLAGVSGGNRILLWDAQSGITNRVLTGPQAVINNLAFSPDGRSLASGSMDGTIGTWDVATGFERSTLSGGTGLAISNLAYTSDGGMLASSQGSRIALWSSDSRRIEQVFAAPGVISSMALSLDGKFIASAGSDGQIRLWAATGGPPQATLPGQVGEAIVGLLFSPDSATLASFNAISQIELWSVPGLKLRRAFTASGDALALAAFGSDSQTIAGLSEDGHLTVFDLAVGAQQVAVQVPVFGSTGQPVAHSAAVVGGVVATSSAAIPSAQATPSPSCPCDAWSSSATPTNPSSSDSSAVELGVKFKVDSTGFITGIRFYKGTGNTGTHIGNLWTTAGQLLATATFTNETATGWQQVNFSSPVSVTANTVYVASYFAPNGHYAGDKGYFASSGVDNPPVHLLQDGVSGGDGVFTYSTSSTFPSSTYQSSNYWVDVVFATSTTPAPLSVTATTPASGATGVSPATAVSATFDNALNTTTVTTSSFTLKDASNTLVAASVSATGNTATLTPSAPLANPATYTATLTTGIQDTNGSSLAANDSWSFTTAAPSTCPCDAWSSSATPTNPSGGNDPSAVELGVKFTVDSAGSVTGIRFYKGTGNTGTHVGNLWTTGGQLLATATFTNETATGWQQVNFSSPVSVAANTVYVASYFAPNGHYAADKGYFANSGVDNPPVHLLQDGVSGGDGVFTYSTSSTFPSSTYQSTNYWVDVVFMP